MVLLAGVVVIQIIKLSMEKWLENYPYRIEMTWWIF